MTELFCALASALLLTASAVVRPDHAACPPSWWLEGVRPDGSFDCRRVPVGDDTWTAAHGERDHSVQPPGVLYSRIYCPTGLRPIVVTLRSLHELERVACKVVRP